jgi:hypothetical protein
MECAFGWRYAAKYNWFLMLPVFFFGEILLITGAVRLVCWYRIRAVQRYVEQMEEFALAEDAAKPLSEQKTRTLANAFAELDPEEDGFVTEDKLQELGRMCGVPLDAAIDVRNVLHYIDPMGTGRISSETWASFVAVSWYKLTQQTEAEEAEERRKDPLGTRLATSICRVFADLHLRTEGLIPLVPETTEDWEKVKDHAIQIFLMLMMMAYITLAKWGISVFDCFEQPNKLGTFNLDDAPYIQCFTSEWYHLSALGGFAILIYVIGLPILITYIFFANYMRLRMGDMQCLQRYGFLYKPYRPGSPGWEVVILVRKSLLVLLTKMRSQSPYMQGVWSLVVCKFPCRHAECGTRSDKHTKCLLDIRSHTLADTISRAPSPVVPARSPGVCRRRRDRGPGTCCAIPSTAPHQHGELLRQRECSRGVFISHLHEQHSFQEPAGSLASYQPRVHGCGLVLRVL